MLKKVRVQIITDRCEIKGSLYKTSEGIPPAAFDAFSEKQNNAEHMEFTTEARYHDDGTRICISYKENEQSGMEGTSTSLSFQKNTPSSLSMLRGGSVKTALIFEPGKQHLCVYQTPVMTFDVCIYTHTVDNRLERGGMLEMDYIIELRGARAARTAFRMHVLPV